MLEDQENIDITTELIRVKSYRISEGLLAYLRSALMMMNYEGVDKKYIMVSAPALIDFELTVLDFAIELLTQWANMHKNKKFFLDSTLGEDKK